MCRQQRAAQKRKREDKKKQREERLQARRLAKALKYPKSPYAYCVKKQGYPTVEAAIAAIHAVFRKGKKPPDILGVYKCKACFRYHLTSNKKSDKKTGFFEFSLRREEWVESQQAKRSRPSPPTPSSR